MRTESLRAARSPRAWNQKNLPSQVESYRESLSQSMVVAIRRLPATTTRLVRRHPALAVSSLMAVGALAWAWGLRRAE